MAPVSSVVEHWWNGVSLRAKITGITVTLLTLGLAVAGAGTIPVLQNVLIEQTDGQLGTFYESLPDVIDIDTIQQFGEVTTGRTPYYVAAVKANGDLLQDNMPPANAKFRPVVSGLTLAAVARLDGAVTLSNGAHTTQWRTLASPLRIGLGSEQATLLIGLSLDRTNTVISRFTITFFLFALVVVFFGAVLTQLLVTTAFAPLRDVEATAARFAAGDYGQRLGGATPNTEVGRLNRSLNTMLARIDRAFADRQRALEQMRRFIGDASHELRTPLVSVRGYAELYRMGAIQKPEDVAQAMDRIEKEAMRMGELVEDLLVLARLDEARPLQLVDLDLLPIAQDAALDASASAPGRQIRVVVAVPPEPESEPVPPPAVPAPSRSASARAARAARREPTTATGAIALAGVMARLRLRRPRPVAATAPAPLEQVPLPAVGPIVRAEENKIRQVVANLIGNAMRFTPDDSPIEIEVGVDARAGFGQISIIDHGEGVPPQLREKIFQRFWRADTSRARDTGGSGLGLAIVAGIVTSHDGHIEVVATPGGGATFRVSLPLANRPAGEHDSTDEASPSAAGSAAS